MENRDYANILDTMPKTGVYIIRQDTHQILYYNQRVKEVSPEVRLGVPCHNIWSSACANCPLKIIEGRDESRSISYNEAFGGVVDLVAARTVWGDGVPAYLITVSPRVDTVGYTYRKVLLVDLERDQCEVLKSDPGGLLFQTSGESFSSQMERFAASGVIHPDDAERFSSFSRLLQLRDALDSGKRFATCIYRRAGDNGGGWRWNVMEAAPGFEHAGGHHTAILCVKDVDDILRDGLALEDITLRRRDQQMAAILRSRFEMLNTVHLDSGLCERIGLDEASKTTRTHTGDYSFYIRYAMDNFVHPEDASLYHDMLSLEHLREAAAATLDYHEEICQYRTRDLPVRWLEQHVIYCRREDGVTVNILGRDITHERDREELNFRTLRDRADVISGLSRLFFSIYYVDLDKDTLRTVTHLGRAGDVLGGETNCTEAMRIYARNFIHPDDRERYLQVMNIQHWRETLRWWQPRVELEFRRLPEHFDGETGGAPDNGGLVRAAAVLAQTGPDDLPKTVVYVAQDVDAGSSNNSNSNNNGDSDSDGNGRGE